MLDKLRTLLVRYPFKALKTRLSVQARGAQTGNVHFVVNHTESLRVWPAFSRNCSDRSTCSFALFFDETWRIVPQNYFVTWFGYSQPLNQGVGKNIEEIATVADPSLVAEEF